jgi:hypothetical protein
MQKEDLGDLDLRGADFLFEVESVSLQRPREICGISSNTLWKFGVGEAYETITFKFSGGVYKVSIPNYLGLWWIFFIILHTV